MCCKLHIRFFLAALLHCVASKAQCCICVYLLNRQWIMWDSEARRGKKKSHKSWQLNLEDVNRRQHQLDTVLMDGGFMCNHCWAVNIIHQQHYSAVCPALFRHQRNLANAENNRMSQQSESFLGDEPRFCAAVAGQMRFSYIPCSWQFRFFWLCCTAGAERLVRLANGQGAGSWSVSGE